MATSFTKPADYPNGSAVLAATINNSTETITVVDGSRLQAANFYIRIGFEQILVVSRSGNTLTCTGGRGANGTTAEGHASGATVYEDILQKHFTSIHTAINGIESGTTSIAATETTVTFGAAATTVNVGKDNTTTINLKAATIASGLTSLTLFNTTATSVSAFGAATSLGLGAATGTCTINNATLAAKAGVFQSGSVALKIGADSGATTLTDATAKYGRIGFAHYTNAEEPVGIFYGACDSTNNYVNIGGGSGSLNAATQITLYCAANNTTTTGTAQLTINATGATFANDLAVNGGDVTSTATTFNLLNATVTTLNLGGAATTVAIGAATGTCTIANATLSAKSITATGRLVTSTVTTFTANDTTPSVAAGNIFKIPGTWTAGNDITMFDDGTTGQCILIIGGNTDCNVVDGGNLHLNGNWNAAVEATLQLVFDGTNWIESAARTAAK